MSLRSSLSICFLFHRTCNTLVEMALQGVNPPVTCDREEPLVRMPKTCQGEEPLVPMPETCQEEDPLAGWTPHCQEGELRLDTAMVVLVSKIFFSYFLFRILIAGVYHFFFLSVFLFSWYCFQSHDYNRFLLLMSHLVHFRVLNTSKGVWNHFIFP